MSASAQASGRPVDLPLSAALVDFGLPLAFLRDAAERDVAAERDYGRGELRKVEGRGTGLFEPMAGQFIGRRLTTRMAELLNRPACVFTSSFIWRHDRGEAMPAHVDRPGLDVTMSVPLVLDGVDAWPLALLQPNGDVLEWPGRPGTVFVFDGRWRPHWRLPFMGDRAFMLLLHWRAPAVLWRGFLDAAACARVIGGRDDRPVLEPDVLERCADLARLAVPPSGVPAMALCDGRLRDLPARPRGRGVRLLVLLEGELAVTFDALDPVTLTPGDGIAFPTREKCRLDWTAPDGRGSALLGHARTPLERRRVTVPHPGGREVEL